LEKTIYKIPVPEELGEAPEYTPKSSSNNTRKKGKWRKNGGSSQKRSSKKIVQKGASNKE
jgi:hypothetical protein